MATLTIREASTAQIPFQLFADNVPIDLSAVTKVQIILVPSNGTDTAIPYNTSDNPTVLALLGGGTNGRVGFTPNGTTDFLFAKTPYKVFFWVFTSATAKYAVPDEGEIVVEVTNDYV